MSPASRAALLLANTLPPDHAPDAPLTLQLLTFDHVRAYFTEVDRWGALHGAARQIEQLHARIERRIRFDSVPSLIAQPGRYLLAFEDAAQADRFRGEIAREAAALTGSLQVNCAQLTLEASALFDGLLPIPARVVGIPGVTPYQARINRYYGLANAGTVPTAEQARARRHFGQVYARLLDQLEATSAGIAPFYECLPFAERCSACRERPTSAFVNGEPRCPVCELRERTGASMAILAITLPGSERALIKQTSSAAFARVAAAIDTVTAPVLANPGALRLHDAYETRLIATPKRGLLDLIAKLPDAVRLPSGDETRVIVSAAYGPAAPRTLIEMAERGHHKLSPDRIGIASSPDSFGTYSAESLEWLRATVERLRGANLPPAAFANLPEQLARGTAALYTTYERLRLAPLMLRALDATEAQWGRESARFYRALADALALIRGDDERV